MKEKREMLLKELNKRTPGREKEFLEFIAMADGSGVIDNSKTSLEDLLNGFIYFEEDNNEEEFTEEIMEVVLETYLKGFNRGEHVF